MNKIVMRWQSGLCYGSVSMKAKYPRDHYEKHGYLSLYNKEMCGVENCEREARYINFMDHNNLWRSKDKFYLESLIRRRRETLRRLPMEFDNTTFWRHKGNHFPVIMMTEPLSPISSEALDDWDDLCEKYSLVYSIVPPSDKSLYGKACSMVFWWNPYMFKPNFKDILGYKSNDKLKKSLTYHSLRIGGHVE